MRGKILIKNIDAVILLGGGAPLGTRASASRCAMGENLALAACHAMAYKLHVPPPLEAEHANAR